ncbi:hypothetical protein AAGG74_15355 [Bacillus mexicanus]|uniref:hypothetical protein n=1 Tax=Bacillus mexicanus TaxID=2834415 RepID=UPI003D1CE7AE
MLNKENGTLLNIDENLEITGWWNIYVCKNVIKHKEDVMFSINADCDIDETPSCPICKKNCNVIHPNSDFVERN